MSLLVIVGHGVLGVAAAVVSATHSPENQSHQQKKFGRENELSEWMDPRFGFLPRSTESHRKEEVDPEGVVFAHS